jgi:MFS family permease
LRPVTPWWRTRNVVIVAGCLIALITFGARTSFGLFTEPLSELRGWDRQTFALAIAVQNLLWGIGQPFAGAIADRYGAARVLAAGGAVYALGVALMSASTTGSTLALSGGVLVGLGLSGGSFTIVIAAFARLVPEDRRSWAMGLATAMGSLGQFVFAPLGQGFISSYGPATALVLIAGCVALVPVLAVALSGGETTDGTAESSSVAIREALTHPSYLLLTSGFFVCGFHIAFVSTHLPPYLTELGLGTLWRRGRWR